MRCVPPKGSVLFTGGGVGGSSSARKVDLLDCYTVNIRNAAPSLSMRSIAEVALGQPPLWMAMLLKMRDAIVLLFGVKTTKSIQSSISRDKRVGFFPILQELQDEIVLGENDKHLDFQLSILRQSISDKGETRIFLTSRVYCNNLFGRIYLLVITPFHKLVVRSMTSRMKERLEKLL